MKKSAAVLVVVLVLLIIGVGAFLFWQHQSSSKMTAVDCQQWAELYQGYVRGTQAGYDAALCANMVWNNSRR